MKKKIILTGIAAVAASATIVGATIGVKSCVDDRKNVTIESATAPVVTLKNGIFYWNQIEGVEGYLVSIDGVVTNIGNPKINNIEGIDVSVEEVEYKICSYALDNSALDLGTHIIKFASYTVGKKGERIDSNWSNAYEIVVTNPAKPTVKFENGSFYITSNAKKLNFVIKNGDTIINATYVSENGYSDTEIEFDDLTILADEEGNKPVFVNGTYYDVTITAESMGYISQEETLKALYDNTPVKPKLSCDNNILTVTAITNSITLTINDNYNVTYLVTPNEVSVIDIDDIALTNNLQFEDGKVYTIKASITKNGITKTSDTIAYKYTDKKKISKPKLSVSNGSLILDTTELDVTFTFNSVNATYKNQSLGRAGIVDLRNLEGIVLEDKKTYAVTATIKDKNGVSYTSDPVIFTYNDTENIEKIEVPNVFVADDDAKFYFADTLVSPKLSLKINNKEYIIELTGANTYFSLNEYLQSAVTTTSKEISKNLIENANALVSLKVISTYNNKNSSDYSKEISYIYKKHHLIY